MGTLSGWCKAVSARVFGRERAPSMVLTWVLAESCMSAGPKSVAPVSRPETVMMTLCIRCSMKGRATTMRTSLSRLSHLPSAIRPLASFTSRHSLHFSYHFSSVSPPMPSVG